MDYYILFILIETINLDLIVQMVIKHLLSYVFKILKKIESNVHTSVMYI